MPTGPTYSLTFINNSTNAWAACVYQFRPDVNGETLAWLAEAAAPTTTIVFQWTVDYGFFWAETGALVPGVIVEQSQTWPANLSTTNQVTLTQVQASVGSYYTFTNQTQGPEPGSLFISMDGTVGLNQVAAGYAMSGAGVLAVQAQPNLNVTFTPNPSYWITFGDYQRGQVLDVSEITNAAQIQFPPNVYAMTATLNINNTWTISPTN